MRNGYRRRQFSPGRYWGTPQRHEKVLIDFKNLRLRAGEFQLLAFRAHAAVELADEKAALVCPSKAREQECCGKRAAPRQATAFDVLFISYALENRPEVLKRLQVLARGRQAEQALRPAVVNRKVWGGNRTQAGAKAQAIVMSVLQTCHQQAKSALSFISNAFRGRIGNLADAAIPE